MAPVRVIRHKVSCWLKGFRFERGREGWASLAIRAAPLPFGGPAATMLLVTRLIGAAGARLQRG
jgi:hypothetical protein